MALMKRDLGSAKRGRLDITPKWVDIQTCIITCWHMNTRTSLALALGLLALSAHNVRPQCFTFTTIAGSAGQSGTNDGVNTSARFYGSGGVALGPDGDLYVLDGSVVRKATRSGGNWLVVSLATLPNAGFGYGIAADSSGVVYIADTAGQTIWSASQVGGAWSMKFLAGGGGASPGSRDGLGASARFRDPYALAVDSRTNLYVADCDNYTIRTVVPSGTSWMVTTIAGLAGVSGSDDGTNSSARFSGPIGITRDAMGDLYVTDYWAHTVRSIRHEGTNWVVTTLAGRPGWPGSNDGTNDQARFNNPRGIAVDRTGNLYVSEASNQTIRRITRVGTNWVVTTIGGLAGNSGSADGLGSSARFHTPAGLAADPVGNLYVADMNNYTLRLGRPLYSLKIAPAVKAVALSWPLLASNFVLETTSMLYTNAAWAPVTEGVEISGDRFSITRPADIDSGFYRLRKLSD